MLDGTRVLDRDALIASLDEQRAVVASKLAGLTREQSVRVAMPSGTTLLGLVGHLRWVEVEWFQQVVAGHEVDLPRDDDPDVDASFAVDASETPELVLAAYAAACAISRSIVDVRALDDVSIGRHAYFGHCTIGWILHHMIRETARHAGHADILREHTDGIIGFL